jgi:hypothetical protein
MGMACRHCRSRLLVALYLFEPRLVDSHTTVVIPFHERIFIVRSLHGTNFPSRLSEVAQTFDAVSRSQFLVSGGGLR